MGLFSAVFGTREERILRTCTSIYSKAKRMRPGKSEREYLKIVLITKPPFDYQFDQILDAILDSCTNIEDLSREISERGQPGSYLWEARERNLKLRNLESRNREFFCAFWGQPG